VSALKTNVGEANSASGDLRLEQKLILFEVIVENLFKDELCLTLCIQKIIIGNYKKITIIAIVT
jgi:hypothetical protein